TRPARHKEQLDEYSIECHERVLRLAENRTRIHVGHSAHVLVDATRIVGEPFDLRCAAGGRWSRSVRLLSQLDCGYLGKAAAAQSGATSSAIRHGGRSNDAYRYRRECVLLSRRAAQRAPRPQHSVLEVAAGVRCHHRACESVHSARHLPLLTFAITVAMQWLMLLLSSAVLLASGLSVATLWTKLSFLRMSLLLLYHVLTAHALWPAPIY